MTFITPILKTTPARRYFTAGRRLENLGSWLKDVFGIFGTAAEIILFVVKLPALFAAVYTSRLKGLFVRLAC